MKQILLFLLFGFFLLATDRTELCAKIYKYVDDKGTMSFVDDESKIPAKYRTKASKLKEVTDGMSPEERKTYEDNKKAESAGKAAAQRSAEQLRSEKESRAASVTHVNIMGNMVIVPIKVRHGRNTATLKMLLDTGASKTVIYLPALERFSFRRSELGFAQLAGGYVVPTETVEFYKVEVGPYVQKRMSIMIIDSVRNSPFDGLLGMDFLRQHKYEVDFARSVIVWND